MGHHGQPAVLLDAMPRGDFRLLLADGFEGDPAVPGPVPLVLMPGFMAEIDEPFLTMIGSSMDTPVVLLGIAIHSAGPAAASLDVSSRTWNAVRESARPGQGFTMYTPQRIRFPRHGDRDGEDEIAGGGRRHWLSKLGPPNEFPWHDSKYAWVAPGGGVTVMV